MATDARTLKGGGGGRERVAIEERHALKPTLVELFVVLASRGHSHHVPLPLPPLCAHVRITAAGNLGIESMMCYMAQYV
jgi:hypothetical protein